MKTLDIILDGIYLFCCFICTTKKNIVVAKAQIVVAISRLSTTTLKTGMYFSVTCAVHWSVFKSCLSNVGLGW